MRNTAVSRWRDPASGLALGALLALILAGLVVGTAGGPNGSAQPPASQRPDDSRFTASVLIPGEELDEPMVLSVLPDERVLIIERKGGFKVYDPVTKGTRLITTIPVNTKYYSPSGRVTEAEEGLIGLTIDPNFTQNRWVYLKYADQQAPKHVLARWELRESPTAEDPRRLVLVESSKRVLLEHPAQRERCCHTGGGMAWDRDGNLYITTGNNTGGGMTDERPGYEASDDQRTAANTNDLRGKILRIHPEPDGSYTIPPGNLFPRGTPRTRPEIYTMGHRNPWRVSIDSRTGFVYWGEVGPSDGRANGGPIPYDEFNQARGPGFFGFPYFVGENEGFSFRDYVNNRLLPGKDPKKPINTSVNNTGLHELPPAQPAFIAYSYETSGKYPELGSGAHSAVGGPIFHRADFAPTAKRLFPAYYEGKWLVADFERGWIMAITMDAASNYVSMEPFLPSYRPLEIIDLQFGPEGDLYILDYGSTWFAKSSDSTLVKIEYTAGNRRPKAAVTASTVGGTPPFQVTFSAAESRDPDGDPLKHSWRIAPGAGPSRAYSAANPTVPFTEQGVYTATLTVTDPAGAADSASIDIVSGNTPPEITMNVAARNATFFQPGTPIDYTVRVADREDGSVASDRVALSIDYVPDMIDPAALRHGGGPVDPSTRFALARALIARSDCAGCHNRDAQSVGPSFLMLSDKYTADDTTIDTLVRKVIAGGAKVWGDTEMPPHPGLPPEDGRTIVRYMLSAKDRVISTWPLAGRHTPVLPPGDEGRGRLVLRAVYTDRPVQNLPAQTSEAMRVLRPPVLIPAAADVHHNVSFGSRSSGGGSATRSTAVTAMADGHIGYRQIDLSGVKGLQIATSTGGNMGAAGGIIEVRSGSPAGPVLGQANIGVAPPPAGRGARAQGAPPAGGAPAPAAPASAAASGGRAGGGTIIELTGASGLQDIYVVFRNSRAQRAQPLFTVSGIRVLMD
jgi:cytochrome c